MVVAPGIYSRSLHDLIARHHEVCYVGDLYDGYWEMETGSMYDFSSPSRGVFLMIHEWMPEGNMARSYIASVRHNEKRGARALRHLGI